MLFPCGFGVFPKSQPRPQDFGRSYNPYGSFGEEVPKTLVRSALPSAVILGGVHLQPRPFHLLDFRPSKIERNARKIALFYLVRNTPETGLVRWSVGVCSTSVGNSPHRATRWLTGATSSLCYIRITGASPVPSELPPCFRSTHSSGSSSFPQRMLSNTSWRLLMGRSVCRYAFCAASLTSLRS